LPEMSIKNGNTVVAYFWNGQILTENSNVETIGEE
jgi:hypothetical protein